MDHKSEYDKLEANSEYEKMTTNKLQDATKIWVKAVLEYYKDTPDRNSLTQIFARGYFAGWSERELIEFVDRLKWNNDNFPSYK